MNNCFKKKTLKNLSYTCVIMHTFMNYKDFIKSILRGIGQVMFQNNALTGLIFLIGIFYASIICGIGALIGTIIGTLTAIFLQYNKKDILAGLYGFNGTLVGIALLVFFEPTISLLLILVVAIIFSTVLMNFMYTKKLAPYTFPFVLTTWIFIFIIKILNLSSSIILKTIISTKIDVISGISSGFGQVMFQVGIVTGILFFIAILINSRISALYALLGSIVGVLIGWIFFPASLNLVNIGIFGYNGVLCAIAFSDKKWYNILFAVLAVILSIILLSIFITLNLIALTAPFVFATWIVLFVRNKCNM